MTTEQRIRRTGIYLALFLLGMILYSFIVIRTRGNLPPPKDLTPLQKMFRGL